MNDDHLRMSDVERDEAARELGEHYAVGRLTTEEHADRLDRIWAARTRGELAPIFRDLPGRFGRPSPGPWRPTLGPLPDRRPRRETASWRRGLPTPLLVLLGVLLVVTVLSHLPVILIGLLVWFFVISRHRQHHPWGRQHR